MGPFTTTERGKSGEKQSWRKTPNESAWRPPVGSCVSLELKPVLIGPFVPFSWRAVNRWSRSSTVHRAAWLGPEPDVLSVCLKGVVLSEQLLEIRLHICKGHGLPRCVYLHFFSGWNLTFQVLFCGWLCGCLQDVYVVTCDTCNPVQLIREGWRDWTALLLDCVFPLSDETGYSYRALFSFLNVGEWTPPSESLPRNRSTQPCIIFQKPVLATG